MGKVQHRNGPKMPRAQVSAGVPDDAASVTYMDTGKVDRLLGEEMARWSTLLERLK